MTLDQKHELVTLAAGKGAILNCNFGFCLAVAEEPDGRYGINIEQAPLGAGDPNFAAQRAFMEETAIKWLKIVAPHRLADDARGT